MPELPREEPESCILLIQSDDDELDEEDEPPSMVDSDSEDEGKMKRRGIAIRKTVAESIDDTDEDGTRENLRELYGRCNLRGHPEPTSSANAPTAKADPLSCISCLNACEMVYPQGLFNTGPEVQEYVDLEVILDSGAGAHVASRKHIPGCEVRDSELKRAGAAFVAIDGGRIENEGEAELNLAVFDGKGTEHSVRTTVQVADVTRALWSVGVLCDAGLDPRFSAKYAKIFDSKGVELCHFDRRHGLYVATVRLRNPAFKGFRRQGR